MARLVRDQAVSSRSARLKLAGRREPYWAKISKGCFVGYRKGTGSGTWVARYRTQSGPQRFQSIGPADDVLDADGTTVLTFDQAQERAREWFRAEAQRDTGQRRRTKYTVAECLADYIAWVKAHRRAGRMIETNIRAFVLPALGAIDTVTLSTGQLRRWHFELAQSPPRARTSKGAPQRFRPEDTDLEEAARKRKLRANRQLTLLKAALNRAWREGMIARNDAWARVAPFGNVEKARSRFLDVGQCQRLINACLPDLRALVQAALLTGARYAELCALNIQDFSATPGLIHVRRGKGGKSRRVILNEEGRRVFQDLATGRPPLAPLLRRDDGSRWGRDLHRRPFKQAVVRAGLDGSLTFHELRHTWASLTIMAGAPLIVVAQNLGHSDTRMVQAHYGHLADQFVLDSIRKAAPSFGISPPTNVIPLPPQPATQAGPEPEIATP